MAVRVDAYLEKFRAFGDAPSLERYMALFHPDATLFDSGMERPLTVPEIPGNITPILAALPDFRFDVRSWRLGGDTVFVEAANQATVGGSVLRWDSVYCMTLEGDQVIRGRRYYDRAPLLSRLQPDLPRLPSPVPPEEPVAVDATPFPGPEAFVEAAKSLWQEPDPQGFARLYALDAKLDAPGLEAPIGRGAIPAFYRGMLGALQGLRLEGVCWAGDDERVLIEWLGKGTARGTPIVLPLVERFVLREGLAVDAVSYFDSIPLATALAGS